MRKETSKEAPAIPIFISSESTVEEDALAARRRTLDTVHADAEADHE